MKKKNPAVTAVLNFFLPGIGFTYLGSPIFIATGIAFFACTVLSAALSSEAGLSAGSIAADIGALLALAAISWEVTNLFNATCPTNPGT